MKYKLLLLIFVLTLSASAQDNGAKMNSKEIKLLGDSVSTVLKRWYIYPDKADLISKIIKSKSQSGGYDKVPNRVELADMMTTDIRKTHYDGHMRIAYAPGTEKLLLTTLSESMQKKEDEMEVSYEQANNFYFVKTEIMQGNIGYIRWDEFAEHTKEAKNTYEAAFRFVSNTKALIIDMRYCRGGWPPTVNAFLNYFFEKRLPMNHIIDHNLDTIKYFTDPKATPFKLNMPVYVLTSKQTFSGAEDFTYALKVAKRAIIIGDTTGGGAHPTETVPLGQGFVMRIPKARSFNEITRGNWEGTGVYPDVSVKSALALEKAKLLIFKDRFENTNNEEEKAETKGQITVAENKLIMAEHGTMNLCNEQLQKFCGVYKPLPNLNAPPSPVDVTILLKENNLYRSIPFPPDWKLIPISSTRFLYDNDDANRFLDFTLDKNGNPTHLTVHYTDGRTFYYEKIK